MAAQFGKVIAFGIPQGYTTATIITGQQTKADILWLVQLTAVLTSWMNASEITVEQLEFICTEHSDGEVEDVLSGSAITDLVGDVAGQFEAALFKSDTLQSAVIDSVSASLLFKAASQRRLRTLFHFLLSLRHGKGGYVMLVASSQRASLLAFTMRQSLSSASRESRRGLPTGGRRERKRSNRPMVLSLL